MAARKRLGELLLDYGLISDAQLQDALIQQQPGKRLGEMLLALGYLDERKLRKALSVHLKLTTVELAHREIHPGVLAEVPGHIAVEARAIPVAKKRTPQGETLYVAMDDPTNDQALELLQQHCSKTVEPMIALMGELDQALARYYPDGFGGAPVTGAPVDPIPAPGPAAPSLGAPFDELSVPAPAGPPGFDLGPSAPRPAPPGFDTPAEPPAPEPLSPWSAPDRFTSSLPAAPGPEPEPDDIPTAVVGTLLEGSAPPPAAPAPAPATAEELELTFESIGQPLGSGADSPTPGWDSTSAAALDLEVVEDDGDTLELGTHAPQAAIVDEGASLHANAFELDLGGEDDAPLELDVPGEANVDADDQPILETYELELAADAAPIDVAPATGGQTDPFPGESSPALELGAFELPPEPLEPLELDAFELPAAPPAPAPAPAPAPEPPTPAPPSPALSVASLPPLELPAIPEAEATIRNAPAPGPGSFTLPELPPPEPPPPAAFDDEAEAAATIRNAPAPGPADGSFSLPAMPPPSHPAASPGDAAPVMPAPAVDEAEERTLDFSEPADGFALPPLPEPPPPGAAEPGPEPEQTQELSLAEIEQLEDDGPIELDMDEVESLDTGEFEALEPEPAVPTPPAPAPLAPPPAFELPPPEPEPAPEPTPKPRAFASPPDTLPPLEDLLSGESTKFDNVEAPPLDDLIGDAVPVVNADELLAALEAPPAAPRTESPSNSSQARANEGTGAVIPRPESEDEDVSDFCPSCGADKVPGAKFCGLCGTQITEPKSVMGSRGPLTLEEMNELEEVHAATWVTTDAAASDAVESLCPSLYPARGILENVSAPVTLAEATWVDEPWHLIGEPPPTSNHFGPAMVNQSHERVAAADDPWLIIQEAELVKSGNLTQQGLQDHLDGKDLPDGGYTPADGQAQAAPYQASAPQGPTATMITSLDPEQLRALAERLVQKGAVTQADLDATKK